MKDKKTILYLILCIALIIAFIGFSIFMFLGLRHFFGTVYAIKTLITSYIVIAIVEAIIFFVEKKIKKKKEEKNKDGE